ncbi:AcrR family transcriptional regulator [Arthrobacter sp. UYP6]|uniref:TetR/AcrR family transcriptional regulator n=1 Tax=Arthrobacter sp. UYP6 TaxID=1756378 RepID=UPI00339B991F
MPKIVDHERRRAEIVQTTWRVIARRGLDGATLREVAAEAGFANGAIKPYFPAKSDLLEATFRHVFIRTNTRSSAAVEGLDGFEALRAFCLEVLPLDPDRLDEARVVIAFWQQALRDPAQAEVNDAAMAQWRCSIRGWLEAARRSGHAAERLLVEPAAETLLSFLLGTQVAAVFDPHFNSPEQLVAQLDGQLYLLRSSTAQQPS